MPRSRSSHELSHAPPYGSRATTPSPSGDEVVVLLEAQVGAVGVAADDAERVRWVRTDDSVDHATSDPPRTTKNRP